MRFSPRFLKVFLRFPAAPSFFSGVAPSGVAASVFAICRFQLSAFSCQLSADSRELLDNLLLRDRALARTLARPRIGLGPLAAHRQPAPVPEAAEAADFHQPLDVHGDLLPEISFDTALLLDHLADLPD